MRLHILGTILLALLVAAAGVARADQAGPNVARLSVIEAGTVTLTPASDDASQDGTLNAPLLPGDGFAMHGTGARAEIQLGNSTAFRLGPDARGQIASNDARVRTIELDAGLAELSLPRGGEPATEIVTPAVTLRTQFAGDYRLAVGADGTTVISVRSGQADVLANSQTVTLVAGQSVSARVGTRIATVADVPRDAFDAFNATRDAAMLAAIEANANLPQSLAGFDDLASYGQWANVASYGNAWVPNQGANWAPYRDGVWANTTAYGMTWVGTEPWAWVPYHYGRWFYARRYGWCWLPPLPYAGFPFWAPALVGFYGYGYPPYGWGTLGWVPLNPYERYYPWYRNGRAVAVRTHVQERANAYANARFGGASSGPMLDGVPEWQPEFVRAATILSAPLAPELPVLPTAPRLGAPVLHAAPPERPAPVDRGTPIAHPAPVTRVAPPVLHAAPPVRLDPPIVRSAPGLHSGSRPPR